MDGSFNLSGIKDPVVDALIDKVTQARSRADLLTGVTGDFGPTATVKYAPFTASNNQPEDRSDCQIPLACASRAGWTVIFSRCRRLR